MSAPLGNPLAELLLLEGYGNLRELEPVGVCGTYRFLFTVGVCFGLDRSGYRGRFCFDTQADAEAFLNEWDGLTYPVIGDDGCIAIKGVL